VRRSYRDKPLVYALGKHSMYFWDEALRGMRVGGRRRVIVPLSAMSASQAACFPPDESIRLELEMISVQAEGLLSAFASEVPPGKRLDLLARILGGVGALTLSFAALTSDEIALPPIADCSVESRSVLLGNDDRARALLYSEPRN